MMLLASTWTVSTGMVEGTERGRMKSKKRSRVGKKEREGNGRRGLRKEKEQKKIRK